tara:strand:- start:4508 stop:5608 length:1101 start_codon:yes stop_codon:yes gene_type:complete
LNPNKLIVVKLSSLAVTKPAGLIDRGKIKTIVSDLMNLETSGYQVVLVCSGAVNAGKKCIENFSKLEMSSLQASSAVGQPFIIQEFSRELKKYKKNVAQVLLTHEDFKHRKRSLNIRSSLFQLLHNHILPIVNENDTVSFDEIAFGDNDQLSALICELMNAKLLCMLTGADGLYDRSPDEEGAKKFKKVLFDQEFTEIDLAKKSLTGRGGMLTKLEAVRKLTPLGIDVYIASYDFEQPITRAILDKEGTWFEGQNKKLTAKKSWILTRTKSGASLQIDLGAKQALLKNSSLLPVGVKSVRGKFLRGDCIAIKYQNETIAFGITEYSSLEVEKIKKLKSSDLNTAIKNPHSKVIIHKNNLILKKKLT